MASTHLFLQAGKLAFADRGLYVADADFVDMPEGLPDPGYLAARAELIDPPRRWRLRARGRRQAGRQPRRRGQAPALLDGPTIVLENGAPVLLIGSPGGSSIIPCVAQALVGILDFGQDPQAAIDAPHVLNRNGPTLVEAGPDADATIAALAGLGQQAEATDLNSGLHAILLRDGQLVGAADKRREGLVMGE